MSQNCWVFVEAIHLYCLVSIPYNMDWSELAVSKYWYWSNGFPFICTLFWAITHNQFKECRSSDVDENSKFDTYENILENIAHGNISFANLTDENLNFSSIHNLNVICPDKSNLTEVFCSEMPGHEALNMSHYDEGSAIFYFPGIL